MKSACAALVAVCFLLSFAADAGDKRSGKMRPKPPRPGEFILNPAEPAPGKHRDRLGELLCRLAERSVESMNCPPTLRVPEAAGVPGTSTLIAELPHFRLAIILERMENQIVSGGGVKQPADPLEAINAFWKIESEAATVSIPAIGGGPFNLPVPDAGEAIDGIDHNNALFQGVIANGCLPTVKTFDLELESSVGALGEDPLGAVTLEDEVPAPGFYVFRYSIQATGTDGGVSRFIFSGDAIAWCSLDDSL